MSNDTKQLCITALVLSCMHWPLIAVAYRLGGDWGHIDPLALGFECAYGVSLGLALVGYFETRLRSTGDSK